MKSCEQHVLPSSDYYNYSPSADAKRAFFYPISTGHFIYEAGYRQMRHFFPSFLLMYIQRGTLEVHTKNRHEQVPANHFVFLDCYESHGYQTSDGWECLWIHFDGPTARFCFSMIENHLGNVFTVREAPAILEKMQQIYHTFSHNTLIREALLSKQITDILTLLLLSAPEGCPATNPSFAIESTVSYITEHFAEPLTVAHLAQKAMLSPYHFIRLFKKGTGFTPHEYLLHTRLTNAKYLLKNSSLSIKDICFQTGFSSESVFCTSFKNHEKMTPAAYRKHSF